MANRIRYAILDHAGDDAGLWELTYALSVGMGGKVVEVHPEITVAEVRPCLAQLLREGHVELYEWDPPEGSRPLELDAALSVIGDDGNWIPPEGASSRVSYSVVTTQSGEGEYTKEHDAHESEG